tara:strand:- start:11808 stop:12995 length:1188 start_codon:yes stop_codon:yes gene_type:complete
MFTKMLDVLSANTSLIEFLTIIIVASAIVAIVVYITVQQAAKQGNCTNMKNLYPMETSIQPILKSDQLSYSINDTSYDTRLRDVYVKASYNSCSAGNYKDDWVSTCALNEVLKRGCRFVDFELYSINHEPAVATSTSTDYYTKETWNSVPFSAVAKLIKNNAFSQDHVPNPTDPLLVHLRFKSNDILMYNKLADVTKTHLDTFLLDNKYSCGYAGEGSSPANVLDATFSSNVLKNKVIILVDGASNSTYAGTDFNEFVNLSTSCSSTPTIMEYRNFTAQTSEDNETLTDMSKSGMLIVLPDLNIKPSNINFNSTVPALKDGGCQIVAQCYQIMDRNLKNYNTFFPTSAFVLKDTTLINPDSTETYPTVPQLACTTQTQTNKHGYTFETHSCTTGS